jgi:mannitol-1-phosphate 5-dehydrogenase
LGPARTAREYRLPIDFLACGIAAAFLYQNEEDEQTRELQQIIKKKGIRGAIAEVTNFREGCEELYKIERMYEVLGQWRTPAL